MELTAKRNNLLDVLRAISCILIIFYHLGLMECGYFAVNFFFVLSAYLACTSLEKHKNNLLNYYWSRFKRLYLPLFVVVCITIFFFKQHQELAWVSLKPESLSVLLSYNNFYRIANESDYFAAYGQSPFTHIWYISLLIQFELILPIAHIITKKLSLKMKRIICLTLVLISVIFLFLFSYKYGYQKSYYHPLSRFYAYGMGIFIYLFSVDKDLNSKEKKNKSEKNEDEIVIGPAFPFGICLLLYVYSMAMKLETMGSELIMMALSTILSVLLIYLSNKIEFEEYRAFKFISDISYELYLVHVPVTYFIKCLIPDIDDQKYLLYSIILTIVLSCIVHFALNFKGIKEIKNKDTSISKKIVPIISIIFLIAVSTVSVSGFTSFINTPDCTAQMEELQLQLEESQKDLEEKQAAYLEKISEYNREYANSIEEIDAQIEKLETTISNMPIMFIGDSVMLGASKSFYRHFNNYYCDAKVSRPGMAVLWTLPTYLNAGQVGNDIVVGLGANGGLTWDVMDDLRELVGSERNIYWLTVTNNYQVYINNMIREYCSTHENTYCIDWETASAGHNDYFYADGLHMPDVGRNAYTDYIYSCIYEVEYNKLIAQRDELSQSYEDEKNKTMSFFGADVLIEISSQLEALYTESQFVSNREFSYETLISEINNQISSESLGRRVVIILDKNFVLTSEEINKVKDNVADSTLYVVNIDSYNLDNINSEIKLIDLSKDIGFDDYLADKQHLNEDTLNEIVSAIKAALE